MQGGGVYKRRQMAYPVAAQHALCGWGGRVPRLRRGEGAVEGHRRRHPAQHLADVRADARVHAGGLCADRGSGLGRRLLEYGAEHYDIREVTVNEQNPQAVGFYEHMGFVTYKRTDRDEQGGPYPLLYMRRA